MVEKTGVPIAAREEKHRGFAVNAKRNIALTFFAILLLTASPRLVQWRPVAYDTAPQFIPGLATKEWRWEDVSLKIWW